MEELKNELQKTNENLSVTKQKKYIGAGIFVGAISVSGALALPFILPALRKICLPYVPATTVQIRNVMISLKKANIKSQTCKRKTKLIDLGSGDGRIALEAARNGFISTGVELNIWLVLYSRIQARLKGLHHSTIFRKKDLWKMDLTNYDVIVIFGVNEMMSQLENKLRDDFKDFASKNDSIEKSSIPAVLACRFPLPMWTYDRVVGTGIDRVWYYNIRTNAKS